jgi:HD-GYP domain-containing protein (c-di-GMP phosphodiesterase class II)
MSSDRPSGSPSTGPDAGSGTDPPAPLGASADAELTRRRGEVLLHALEQRLPGARDHADATASYAFVTAGELRLDRDQCHLVREAARLHEVGKLYVRAELLSQPSSELSSGQREELESHPIAGQRLALGAGVPAPACEWILHWGERFDEARDPARPAGADLPLPSRIIAAACEYDVQLRDHAAPGGRRRALIGLIEAAGGRLDPMVVDAMARVVERAAEGIHP